MANKPVIGYQVCPHCGGKVPVMGRKSQGNLYALQEAVSGETPEIEEYHAD